MEKNKVYQRSGGIRMVCIVADEEYACMCPIRAHRLGDGYKIIIALNEIYSQEINAGIFEEVGYISSPNLHLYKNDIAHT